MTAPDVIALGIFLGYLSARELTPQVIAYRKAENKARREAAAAKESKG